VIDVLSDLFILRGILSHGNGPGLLMTSGAGTFAGVLLQIWLGGCLKDDRWKRVQWN